MKPAALVLAAQLLTAPALLATYETAELPTAWTVWSSWYFPFDNSLSPNIYGSDEAMPRYDSFAQTNSTGWELAYHGPPQPSWAGYCHAWAGASVWEGQPAYSKVRGGVTFRVRDQKALMAACYFNDTLAPELFEYRPRPGLVWRYLRQEILGDNAMHGHGMALIGNLTQYAGEVWNFPIYKYEVSYSADASGTTVSGSITLWFADDGVAAYADSTALHAEAFTYAFSGVKLDASGRPLDSGSWAGPDPSRFPTSLWRPVCRASWADYAANPALNQAFLAPILDSTTLAAALGSPTLNWTTGGDGAWTVDDSGEDVPTARSGAIGDNQSSWVQTTVSGPGKISFLWKTSSEEDQDGLHFFVEGEEYTSSLSGTTEWENMSCGIEGAGAHVLKWIYSKNQSGAAGSDCGWLSQVTWMPATCASIIGASSSPTEGGAVTGCGVTICGSLVNLQATANSGYSFICWTDDGAVVSTAANYSFIGNGDRNLIAVFNPGSPILEARNEGSAMILSWGASWLGYRLEASSVLGAGESWSPVAEQPAILGSSFSVTNSIDGGSRFYRLRHD